MQYIIFTLFALAYFATLAKSIIPAYSAAMTQRTEHPLASLPLLPPEYLDRPSGSIPSKEQCYALWDKYTMPEHIREHSLRVADMAYNLAIIAAHKGFAIIPEEVNASALLHDIAKSYAIDHGGSHAQIGASWVVQETGNRRIGAGVLHHVHWPWRVVPADICQLPFFIIYADKRVKHTAYVSLQERFEDLLSRYGHSDFSCQSIHSAYMQGQEIETALGARLGMELHAYTPHSGRRGGPHA